jgi:DNA-binding beta-propeller fold protein YncE
MKRLFEVALVVSLVSACAPPAQETSTPAPAPPPADGTDFRIDPFWPKPLPNDWLLGEVSGVAVDSRDHVWIVQRPRSLSADEAGAAQEPPISVCCKPAPAVLEFDSEGNVVGSWGGPGEGFEWPALEHGIFVDYKDNVWIGGNGPDDHQVLKFSRDGTFLLQIGKAGKTEGSNHTSYLGRPADIYVDAEANEAYIADGYGNRRVIVFDADSGEYRRHWGAYGNEPDDTDPGAYDPDGDFPQQFRTPVHAVNISDDGLVYVADRVNNRIQVFQKSGEFVEEILIAKRTLGAGAVWDLDFSPDTEQRLLYNADGTNQQVWVLERGDLQLLGSFGRRGRYAGQFHWVHSLAADRQGNIYTGEVNQGRRLQKFVPATP